MCVLCLSDSSVGQNNKHLGKAGLGSESSTSEDSSSGSESDSDSDSPSKEKPKNSTKPVQKVRWVYKWVWLARYIFLILFYYLKNLRLNYDIDMIKEFDLYCDVVLIQEYNLSGLHLLYKTDDLFSPFCCRWKSNQKNQMRFLSWIWMTVSFQESWCKIVL